MTFKDFTLEEIVNFQPKSKLKASDGESVGNYPFYTSSERLTKYTNRPSYKGPGLIIGTGGNPNIHYTNRDFSCSGDCLVLSEKSSSVDLEYLFFFIKNNLEMLATGFRGAGLKHISKDYVKNLIIPVPNSNTQKSYIKKNQLIVEIQKKRIESDILSRNFALSVFLEMFGDPIINEKKWKSESLLEVCKLYSGATPSTSNDDYWNGDIPWFSPKDLKKDDLWDSIDHISSEALNNTKIKLLPKDTIVIVVRGMILAHSFPVSLIRIPSTINQDVKALLPQVEINPQFLATCIRAQRSHILSLVTEAGHGTKRLDTNELNKVAVLLPPLELQLKFCEILDKCNSFRESLHIFNLEIGSLENSVTREFCDLKTK